MNVIPIQNELKHNLKYLFLKHFYSPEFQGRLANIGLVQVNLWGKVLV